MRKGIRIIEAVLGVNRLREEIEQAHGDEREVSRTRYPSWVVTEYDSGRLSVQCMVAWDFGSSIR